MFTLVFAFDTTADPDTLLEGLEDYMDQSCSAVDHGFHVTTVEFDMETDEIGAHRLGKMISKTFPEIDYYVKED